MGIGVRLVQIDCDVESASGGWARRRNRQRRRGSDELAIFASMHDLVDGRHLAFYRWHRGNVDSGDTFRPYQSLLAPEDSSDQILLTVVAREIDGAGSLSALVEREYEHWKEISVELGGFALPPGNRGRRESERGSAFFDFGLGWLANEIADDLIALDRIMVTSAPMSEVLNAGSLPEREDIPSIGDRGISLEAEYGRYEEGLLAKRTYNSTDANSRYSFHFGFRTE